MSGLTSSINSKELLKSDKYNILYCWFACCSLISAKSSITIQTISNSNFLLSTICLKMTLVILLMWGKHH
jgi:hypothetical protein